MVLNKKSHYLYADASDGCFRAPGRRSCGPTFRAWHQVAVRRFAVRRFDGSVGILETLSIKFYFCTMEKPIYNIESSSDRLFYEFESNSDYKIIKKAVVYLPIKQDPNLYELIFGDLQDDGTINVQTVSNNQDIVLILNTVIKTLYHFFELYPSKTVIFTGSSASRNRLYRAVISKLINEKFDIFGITFDDEIELFVPNKNYFAFQICLKQ